MSKPRMGGNVVIEETSVVQLGLGFAAWATALPTCIAKCRATRIWIQYSCTGRGAIEFVSAS